MKKRSLYILLVSLAIILGSSSLSSASESDLRINELCPSNNGVIADDFGEYDDWIEIYNSGDVEVDLNGLYISDDISDPFKWQLQEAFDEELLVAPNSYIVLWADNQSDQGGKHLGFSLSMNGEDVLLSSSSFEVIDEHSYTQVLPDLSLGWDDNLETWRLYSTPTPESENTGTNYAGLTPQVAYSEAGGLKSDAIDLALTCPLANAEIRYATDGSAPDENSNLYSDPMSINSSMVFRAIAYVDDYYPSIISTSSYIYDEGLDLDIISIIADDDELWDPVSGIYDNPFSGDEIRVSCSYYSNTGNENFSQDLGMKIHAPDSRSQKSLRFYARNEYGSNTIDYQIFEQKPYSDIKRFILRNSGNDGIEIGHTALRDPLISQLFHTTNTEEHGYAAYHPVNVFLNGEYWGIYNIRERQDDYWLYQQYGYLAEDIDYLERTAEQSDTRFEWAGNWDDYDLMEQSAINLDLSDETNYQVIADWINVENYVDYQFVEIFICNQDWLSNNMKFWKPTDNSRKWEWIIWDTDWGFGTYYPSYPHGFPDWDGLGFSLSNWGGWTNDVETELLQNLVESDIFLEYFSTRGADILNSYLKPTRIIPQLDDFSSRIAPDIDRQVDKWGGSESEWSDDVDYMEEFISERPDFVREHFAERFELGEIYDITLNTLPETGGYIEVNTIETDEIPWTGKYYEEIPVRLKAVANFGFVFDHWEETGAEEDEIWIAMDGAQEYTAVFEEIEDLEFPVLNEVFYNPSNEYDPGEWVEFYNPNPMDLDLSSWTFLDEGGNTFTFPEGSLLASDSFLILCSDTLNFKLLNPDVLNYVGNFSFNLDNAGEVLEIQNQDGYTMDMVEYSSSAPWPLINSDVGQSIELLLPTLDNDNGSNWFANEIQGGSPGLVNQIIIDVEEAENTPHFSLYPNPFSSEINLIVSQNELANIKIQVYNSLGQLMTNLANVQQQKSGLYKYVWNTNNSDGTEYPSGVYFFRIEMNGSVYHTQAVLSKN